MDDLESLQLDVIFDCVLDRKQIAEFRILNDLLLVLEVVDIVDHSENVDSFDSGGIRLHLLDGAVDLACADVRLVSFRPRHASLLAQVAKVLLVQVRCLYLHFGLVDPLKCL